MSRKRILGAAVAASLVGMLTLSACAGGPAAAPPTSSDAPGSALETANPAPPDGEVQASGTVMDIGGSIELCLGAVAESYPPQCSGIPISGWSWDGIEGSESSGDVAWGAYAITGTYDGETFTVTQPPLLLALYDPIAPEDPTGGEPGSTPESELIAIQDGLPAVFGDDGSVYLGSLPEKGRLWVDVVWDDGTLQAAADEDYGQGVVIIRSALHEIVAG